MFKDIIIIDNIFPEPDDVVNFAMQQVYNKNPNVDFDPKKGSCWRGLRTDSLSFIDNKRHHEYTKHIIESIIHSDKQIPNTIEWKYEYDCDLVFHKLQVSDSQQQSWIHSDSSVYAGVIYLSRDPPLFSGTLIKKDKEEILVQNVFNRLVLYRADYKHTPLSGFGEGENSRLTISLFFRKINVSMVWRGK